MPLLILEPGVHAKVQRVRPLAKLDPRMFGHFPVRRGVKLLLHQHRIVVIHKLCGAISIGVAEVEVGGVERDAEFLGRHQPCAVQKGGRRIHDLKVDAVNHALEGIPEDRVRYHLCWGSWHGPHTHDLPFQHIIDLMMRVKAQCYSFEAGNVRHEHEWELWKDVKLPDGKMILPGVVSHSTNLIEHPELVAERIQRFASCVGRDNVIAGTDCGLGGRVHAEIAWAKLRALAEGAELASKRLW